MSLMPLLILWYLNSAEVKAAFGEAEPRLIRSLDSVRARAGFVPINTRVADHGTVRPRE